MAQKDLTPWGNRRPGTGSQQRSITPFSALQQEMDRLFEDFFQGFGWAPFRTLEAGTFVPRVELKEDEKALHITAELPGVDEKDIRLSATRDSLIIEGEKKEEREENQKEKGFYRTERYYGSFRREIALPAEVNMEKAEADFKNGVLKLSIPKSEQAQKATKQIPINKSNK